ncbi:MAG: MopE-related protein [Bradymonadia bacterium]
MHLNLTAVMSLALVLGPLWGCTPEEDSDAASCSSNDECSAGQICSAGSCVISTDGSAVGTPCQGAGDPCDDPLAPDGSPAEGVCGQSGVQVCEDEIIICRPTVDPGPIERCGNALDDDCDGQVDEADPQVLYQTDSGEGLLLGAACEVTSGACRAQGLVVCGDGGDTLRCEAPPLEGVDETCNGTDDDCDGQIDEGLQVGERCTVGEGACAVGGVFQCDEGGQVVCEGAPMDPLPELCNGIDDDCDGRTDEDYPDLGTACIEGLGGCAGSGRVVCDESGRGTMCDAEQRTPEPELCGDGADNDCDGLVDEDFRALLDTPCDIGVGACAVTGRYACDPADLTALTCSARPADPRPDTDCDNIDDDCDGAADEGFIGRAVDCGVGACAAGGRTVCVDGEISDTCSPVDPIENDVTCDNIDDDCDGRVDEDFEITATICGVGMCRAQGVLFCRNGQTVDNCVAGEPLAIDARCDGVDEDCDGAADEDHRPAVTACGTGACAAEGQAVCVGGRLVDGCTPGAPDADTNCDGVDDDCDGLVDEGYVRRAVTCGEGICVARGVTTCVAGVERELCTPGRPAPSDDRCDGLDEDCDGRADEDVAEIEINCGLGVCAATGLRLCDGGQLVERCDPGAPEGPDRLCDGVDADCDGLVDEGYVSRQVACGDGACAATGITVCRAGEVIDTCRADEPAPDDATCDGVDDDCDGRVDEDFVGARTTCGVGVCAAAGAEVCVNGEVRDTCTAGEPVEDDALCDGRDSDCDGQVDERYRPRELRCGVGVCAATGALRCVDGQETEDCTPGAPVGDDESCDGLDDDCDGAIDEAYTAVGTQCGVGQCESVGQRICVNGSRQDSCTPGQPQPDDDCDGVDDDCDGNIDEGFVPEVVQCGVGACAAVGRIVCQDGALVNSCAPGEPSAADRTCDGIDDDCDGAADEDYRAQLVGCGQGACANEGAVVCQNGQEVNTCRDGEPAPNDVTCNGVDDDCDGQVDEDYQGLRTRCGVGQCGRFGVLECRGGQIVDSCTPGDPARADLLCDGVDEDCDGNTDEDAGPQLGERFQLTRNADYDTSPRLAWGDEIHGLAWLALDPNQEGSEVRYMGLDRDGRPVTEEVVISQGFFTVAAPAIVWAEQGFAIAHDALVRGWQVYLHQVDRGGQPVNDQSVIGRVFDSQGADLGWHGQVGAVWSQSDPEVGSHLFYGNTDFGGEFEGAQQVTDSFGRSTGPKMAFNEQAYGVAWQDSRRQTLEVFFTLLDPSGERLIDDIALTDSFFPSSVIDIFWTGEAFAIVWADANREAGAYLVYLTLVDTRGERLNEDVLLTRSSFSWGLEQISAAWALDQSMLVLASAEDFGGGRYAPTVQGFARDGSPLTAPIAAGAAAGDIRHTAVSWDGERFVLVWTSSPPDPSTLFSVSGTLGCF